MQQANAHDRRNGEHDALWDAVDDHEERIGELEEDRPAIMEVVGDVKFIKRFVVFAVFLAAAMATVFTLVEQWPW